jgi:hypothetical protein
MMTNALAGTWMFPRSLSGVVTGDTAVGDAGVLASKRFALWSTCSVQQIYDAIHDPFAPGVAPVCDTYTCCKYGRGTIRVALMIDDNDADKHPSLPTPGGKYACMSEMDPKTGESGLIAMTMDMDIPQSRAEQGRHLQSGRGAPVRSLD